MIGGGSRRAILWRRRYLAAGAGQSVFLNSKENFQDSPHLIGARLLIGWARGKPAGIRDRVAITCRQLRIASQCDSPALRSIIAANVERLGGK